MLFRPSIGHHPDAEAKAGRARVLNPGSRLACILLPACISARPRGSRRITSLVWRLIVRSAWYLNFRMFSHVTSRCVPVGFRCVLLSTRVRILGILSAPFENSLWSSPADGVTYLRLAMMFSGPPLRCVVEVRHGPPARALTWSYWPRRVSPPYGLGTSITWIARCAPPHTPFPWCKIEPSPEPVHGIAFRSDWEGRSTTCPPSRASRSSREYTPALTAVGGAGTMITGPRRKNGMRGNPRPPANQDYENTDVARRRKPITMRTRGEDRGPEVATPHARERGRSWSKCFNRSLEPAW